MRRSDVGVSVMMQPLFFLLINTLNTSAYAQNDQAQDNQVQNEQIINNEHPTVTLSPVVITATRSEKALDNAPISTQVLDKKTLEDNHAHTLKQALELLPNVYLEQIHGKTGYEVRMQGFSGDQVLVLIDGLPITASTGSTVNLNQYLNTNVEQIEVVQGAASAQYGSSAMGGVINVITKPISDSAASITAEIGTNGSQNPSDKSFDNNRTYIEASIDKSLTSDKRLKARLSGSYLDDKGLSVDQDKWPRLKDASKQKQINAKLSYTPNINEVDRSNPSELYWVEAGLYKEKDNSRFNYYVPPRYIKQQRDEDIDRKRFSLGAQTQFEINNLSNTDTESDDSGVSFASDAFSLSGSVLYEDYESASDTFSNNTLTTNRDTNMKTRLAQGQLDLPLIIHGDNQSHAIQVGVKWQKDELEQTKNNISELVVDDVDRDVIETYLQDDWFIGNDLEVIVGARYQDDSDFGSHIAPKVAVKKDYYDANNHKHIFRASVGKGYRVPNLKERYYVFDHSNLGYKVMGNPNLEPEESTSYQVGYQTRLFDAATLSINGFYNDVKDLIQTDNNNPTYDGTVAIYSYDNIDKAETYGGDINVNWKASDKTDLNLGYAYLHTKNKTTGSELTYSPEHKVTANIGHQLTDKLQLVQQVTYESKQLVNTRTGGYSPDWWRLDSRANYAATPNLDVYLAVNNILDEQRDSGNAEDQRPIDNREWLVGATYHW